MDLGYKPEPTEPPQPTTSSERETRYPSLSLQDDSVDKLKGEHQCAVGDEYYADGVRLRVKAVSDDTYGKRLEFDVLSIDDFEPAEESDEDETDDSMTGDSKKKVPKALRYS